MADAKSPGQSGEIAGLFATYQPEDWTALYALRFFGDIGAPVKSFCDPRIRNALYDLECT